MSLSKSAKYYRENKKARDEKKKYDAKLNSSKEQIQKRVESNAKRREAKEAGKDIRGKDWDHRTRKFIPASVNRGAPEKSRLKGSKRKC